LATTVAELAARWLAPRPIVLRAAQWRGVPGVSDTNLGEAADNDPDLFWRFLPNKKLPDDAFPLRGIVSNGQGLREDHEIPCAKKPGELRLLFLGDSNTFGWALLHHESFVYQAESILRSKVPEARLECINAGIPGFTLFQGFRFLETRGFRYQPDLIVLDFGMNEGRYWDRLSDLEHSQERQTLRSFPILSESRLWQMAWAAGNRWGTRERKPRLRLLPEEFRLLLIRSHEAARRHGADLLLLSPPVRQNVAPDLPPDARCPYQHELLSYGRSKLRLGPEQVDGVIDCVSIVRDMAKKNTAGTIFSDPYHTTSAANARIAAAIAKKLVPWVRSRLAQKENSTPSAVISEKRGAVERAAETNADLRKAVAEIKKLGGELTVNEEHPGKFAVGVQLSHTELTAEGLKCL
jgi:lysophospholipase L1-like esterase